MKLYFLKISSIVNGCKINANFAVSIDIAGRFCLPAASFPNLPILKFVTKYP